MTHRTLVYHVKQDGADFYVYTAPECEQLVMTRTYPAAIKDWDMEAAQAAREWFKGLCGYGQMLVWISPDGTTTREHVL